MTLVQYEAVTHSITLAVNTQEEEDAHPRHLAPQALRPAAPAVPTLLLALYPK